MLDIYVYLNLPLLLRAAIQAATIGLWILAAIQDLRRREVSMIVLVALSVVALLFYTWPWWVLGGLALLWPWQRRRALVIAPLAIGLGLIECAPLPALVLATSITAWALGWWGGADGIVLLAVSLRYLWPGLVLACAVVGIVAIATMIARKQSLTRIIATIPDVLAHRPRDGASPADTEFPAAAVFALVGVALEGVILWQTIRSG